LLVLQLSKLYDLILRQDLEILQLVLHYQDSLYEL